jgi:virulence factor Mce-like protein
MLRRAFVLVAVAATAVTTLPACSSARGYEVTAYFDKAVSLYPKGDVKILGLSSGKITSVKVLGTQVRVRMRINEGTPLPQDVRATIVPLSLIGERYVQLFPPWTAGEPQAPAGTVIPLERTTIPVEPDEALAALKKFLDTLDPNATGRLVKNLAQDLKGNGQTLNDALGQFAQLTTTLADKDEQLAHLIENFDQFTATLRTREGQLGKVLDQFAATTGLLAQERETIARVVKGLAQVSSAGLDLVSEHAGALNTDVQTLTRLLETVNVNLDDVRRLLTATPELVAGVNLDGKQGILASYDPTFHHIDLRQSTSPTLALLLDALGLPLPLPTCLPIDVTCVPSSMSASSSGPPSAPAPQPSAKAPVDAIVGLLGSPAASTRTTEARPRSSGFHRAARWFAEAVS